MIKDFGAPYEIITPGIGVKPYPACRAAHRAIDAMLHLVHMYHLQPNDVSEIICNTSARMRDFLVHHQPQTGLAGSLAWSTVWLRRSCTASWAWRNSRMSACKITRALMQRVRLTHPDQDKVNWDRPVPDVVEVVLHSGARWHQRIEVPKGDPDQPLTWAELVAKFQDCAATVLPRADREATQHIAHLEELPTLKPLMASLTLYERA